MRTQALIGLALAVLLVGCDSRSGARSDPTAGTAGSMGTAGPMGTPGATGPMGATGSKRAMGGAGATGVPASQPGMGMMGGACPMQVSGATVKSADVKGGVTLTFTTTGDSADLRQRVRQMAEMHNRRDAGGGMMMGGSGRAVNAEHGGMGGAMGHPGGGHGGMMMGGGMRMPAATAAVEDVDRGARLIFRPKAPAELEALREHTRMRAARMARGECPTMRRAEKQAAVAPRAGHAGYEAHHPSSAGK